MFTHADAPVPKKSGSIHPDVLMDLRHQLQLNCDQIRERYASFVSRLCRHLNRKKVPVHELRTYLCRLPELEDNKEFLSCEPDTINGIIDLIGNRFASFLHYGIFQSILNEYCSDEEKNCDVMKYSEHLKDYIKKHNIKEFLDINPILMKLTKNSKKLCLKIDIEKTTKIAEVMDFERTIARILEIRPSSVKLFKIENGCVILTFLIPDVIADNIFSATKTRLSRKQIEMFQRSSVRWLECDGYHFEIQSQVDDFSMIAS